MSTATLEFDVQAPAVLALDYMSTVTVARKTDVGERLEFTGHVVAAAQDGDYLTVQCETMPAFRERSVGDLVSNAPAIELIYALARDAGFREEEVRIEGIQELPTEVFEVATPLSGVDIPRPVAIGDVTFVPADRGAAAVGPLDQNELRDEFCNAAAHAVVYRTASRLLHAELEGLASIDTAVAWLTVRARYALATLPGHGVPNWSRELSLSAPQRRDLVAVRGLRTRRCWIRRPGRLRSSDLPVGTHYSEGAAALSTSSGANSFPQAVLACARAATSTDPLAQVTALWEALEFRVGGTSVPRLFTDSELKRIRRNARGNLTGAKLARLNEMVGNLNQAPLMVRLRRRLALDGVAITNDEVDLLRELRNIRNDVVHGRPVAPPRPEQVTQGIAIVARILVFAAYRQAEAGWR